jgi:hypothetical protein
MGSVQVDNFVFKFITRSNLYDTLMKKINLGHWEMWESVQDVNIAHQNFHYFTGQTCQRN